jgi:uncharacterized protein (DUF2267 family)
MSTTSLEAFDRTIHQTNDWLKDLMFELGWEDRRKAYGALRTALHVLRDRLTPEEAAHLGAQLPMLVRGFYYEGWNPAGKPIKARHKDDFFERIKARLPDGSDMDPQTIVLAVFKLLAHRVSKGEMEDIHRILPEEIAQLWPRGPTG